jgi:hypothetical protein
MKRVTGAFKPRPHSSSPVHALLSLSVMLPLPHPSITPSSSYLTTWPASQADLHCRQKIQDGSEMCKFSRRVTSCARLCERRCGQRRTAVPPPNVSATKRLQKTPFSIFFLFTFSPHKMMYLLRPPHPAITDISSDTLDGTDVYVYRKRTAERNDGKDAASCAPIYHHHTCRFTTLPTHTMSNAPFSLHPTAISSHSFTLPSSSQVHHH